MIKAFYSFNRFMFFFFNLLGMAELECFPVYFFPLYQAGSWRETDSTHKGFHQRVFRHKIVFRSTNEVKGPLRNVKRQATARGRCQPETNDPEGFS